MKTTIIPGHGELTARLIAVDDEPHLVERFYPLLLKVAGQERTGEGIAVLLALSLADYTKGQPQYMYAIISMRLWQFVPALTDDFDVRAAACAALRAAGFQGA